MWTVLIITGFFMGFLKLAFRMYLIVEFFFLINKSMFVISHCLINDTNDNWIKIQSHSKYIHI